MAPLPKEKNFEPLKVTITFSGPTAAEIRRICDNLDIGVQTFVKKAVKGELRSMGIVVE